MKKVIILIIISISVLTSCYIAETEGSNTGTVSFELPAISKEPTPEVKLKINFFKDGDMSVDQNISGISYLTEYPSAEQVTGQTEFSYAPGNNTGIVTITGVPADTPLQLLAEYSDSSAGYWEMTYAGLSTAFTVQKEENTNVSISLVQADTGTINLTLPDTSEYSYFILTDEDSFNSYVTISGSGINYDRNSDPLPLIVKNTSASYPLELTAILPGRKMRLFARNFKWNGDGSSVAVSDSFEVLPGQTVTDVGITYYTFYC